MSGHRDVVGPSRPRLLFAGLVSRDVVVDVPTYPREDDKTRCVAGTGVGESVGGNAANAATVARWVMGEEGGAVGVGVVAVVGSEEWAVDKLRREGMVRVFGVGADEGIPGVSTSMIWRSQATGSRTVVHVRVPGARELSAEEVLSVVRSCVGVGVGAGAEPVHLHVECRSVETVVKVAEALWTERGTAFEHTTMSVEVEKTRPPEDERVVALLPAVSLVVFSKQFVRERGWSSPEEAVAALLALSSSVSRHPCSDEQEKEWVFTLGEGGSEAFVVSVNDRRVVRRVRVPAEKVDKVVDSVGAGDAFLGALVVSRFVRRAALDDALRDATLVAAAKLRRVGLVPVSVSESNVR